ncbi:MAG: hypothetical protein IH604_10660 [Burkholderiales bacterium]|nr:hypothetical protein [Burkholderiales bacterium]
MANTVTPLRRFLWRYGRDLSAPRKSFPRLVETFLEAEIESKLSITTVRNIFAAFPDPQDAAALKRDALGIGGTTFPLIPQLSLPEFFEIVARDDGAEITASDVEARINHVNATDIVPISQLIEANKDLMLQWSGVLYARFADVADRSTVLDDRLPATVRSTILRARPDLLDNEVAVGLSNGALRELVVLHGDDEMTRRVATTVVTRDYGYEAEKLLFAAPLDLTCSAIAVARQGDLERSWAQVISRNASRLPVQNILSRLQTTADFATAVSLIRISPRSRPGSTEWSNLLERSEDNVAGDARISFYAFLLTVALVQESDASWKLVARSLPAIHEAVMKSSLPEIAYGYLNNELPRFSTAHYWDLNKRILLSLATLRQHFPSGDAAAALNLNSDDTYVLNHGLDEEQERSRTKLWWFK